MRPGVRSVVLPLVVAAVLWSCADPKPSVSPSAAAPTVPTATPAPTPAGTLSSTAVIEAFLAKVQAADARFSIHQTVGMSIGGFETKLDSDFDRNGADSQVTLSIKSGEFTFELGTVMKDGTGYVRYGSSGPWQRVEDPTIGRLPVDDLDADDLTVVASEQYDGAVATHLRNVRPIPYRLVGSTAAMAGMTGEIETLDVFVGPDGTPLGISMAIKISSGADGGATEIEAKSDLSFTSFGTAVEIKAPAVEPTLTIAVSMPSGTDQYADDVAADRSIATAIRERGGAINGWRIVVHRLHQDSADDERINATQAVFDPSVVAYLGPTYADPAAKAIPVTCAVGVAQVAWDVPYAGFTRPVDGRPAEPEDWYRNCPRNFFRVIPSEDAEQRAAVAWMKRNKVPSVWIVTDGSETASAQAAVVRSEAKRLKIAVKGSSTVADPSTSTASLARAIVASKPGMVYAAGTLNDGTARLWHDVRAKLPKLRLMGMWRVMEYARTGTAVEDMAGTLFTLGWVGLALRGTADDDYASLVGAEDASTRTGVYAYDAARVVLDAIDRATSTNVTDLARIRRQVHLQIAATTDFPSSVGPAWSFDDAGDIAPNRLSLYRLGADGSAVPVEILTLP